MNDIYHRKPLTPVQKVAMGAANVGAVAFWSTWLGYCLIRAVWRSTELSSHPKTP